MFRVSLIVYYHGVPPAQMFQWLTLKDRSDSPASTIPCLALTIDSKPCPQHGHLYICSVRCFYAVIEPV